jgi:mannose-1-phosphate guanylyltransferase
MEHAAGVRVVPLDAGWDDVGSWDAAARLRPPEKGPGSPHVLIDSARSAIFGGSRPVALVGIDDVVVVDTPDALLVVARSAAEKVKLVVDELRSRRRTDVV